MLVVDKTVVREDESISGNLDLVHEIGMGPRVESVAGLGWVIFIHISSLLMPIAIGFDGN